MSHTKSLTYLDQGEILLVGLAIRTSNHLEIDPDTANIGALWSRYNDHHMYERIMHRAHPGRTFSVYTHYESNYLGEYTYLLGEEVSSFEGQDLNTFQLLRVEPQHYQRMALDASPLPDVVIQAWQDIWFQESSGGLGIKRRYHADFEVYDFTTSHQGSSVSIFLGINKE